MLDKMPGHEQSIADTQRVCLEMQYAKEYAASGYFAAVAKGTLFDFAIAGKEKGRFTL